MWRPTNHDPANFERVQGSAAPSSGSRGGVSPRALPLQPRGAGRRRSTRSRVDALREHDRRRVRDRRRRRRLPRRLAPRRRARSRARARACRALKAALERCNDDDVAAARELRRRRRHDRPPIDELARSSTRCDGHPRLGICLDTCHLYVSGSTSPTAATLDRCSTSSTAHRPRPAARAARQRRAAPLGSNRDRHANIGEGELGESSASSSPPRAPGPAGVPRDAGSRTSTGRTQRTERYAAAQAVGRRAHLSARELNYRWLVLAAGTLSATSLSAGADPGLSAITPALRTGTT